MNTPFVWRRSRLEPAEICEISVFLDKMVSDPKGCGLDGQEKQSPRGSSKALR